LHQLARESATLSAAGRRMSSHFLFRSEDHLKKSLADPKGSPGREDMIEDKVQGATCDRGDHAGLR